MRKILEDRQSGWTDSNRRNRELKVLIVSDTHKSHRNLKNHREGAAFPDADPLGEM